MKSLFLFAVLALSATSSVCGEVKLVRSSGSGRWSDPATWEGRQVPTAGERVQIRSGHVVAFDTRIESPLRSIHIAGTLDFDPDRDTLLTVGLIKVQAGDDAVETGFDVHGSKAEIDHDSEKPSLLVGTSQRPISAQHKAIIRLAEVEGLDPELCPAIVCQGGRMEFHGAKVNPTWVKLGKTAEVGETSVVLDRPVDGWKVGDRVIVTATRHQYHRNDELTPKVRQDPRTEERLIRAIEGTRITLDGPLTVAHLVRGDLRGEVALLSRNVVVESANPAGVRGHTMYHRDSVASISYAEFRHLGKPGKLGKYSLHFHKAGDSMRGASVVGASIWDSANRWITIHGTNRLVIRDCVGYQSQGHGFFLEDGTEVDNIFDGNLAVQATESAPLAGQILAYDRNEGAGFWWANSRNSFTRNVAVECDGYGYRFEAPTSKEFDPVLPIRGHDGRVALGDIRTQPFLRFDSNEAHCQRRYGVNLGGEPGLESPAEDKAVGPDSKHPLRIRNLRIWDCHWAFTPATPGLLVDKLQLAHCEYGFWKANFDRQAYSDLSIYQCGKAYSNFLGTLPDPSIFPRPLEPVDDRPPVTVITEVEPLGSDRFRVEGCSVDDGQIKSVKVNGQEVRPLVPDFSRWELILEPIHSRPITLSAAAVDAAGNIEKTPHLLTIATRAQDKTTSTTRPHQPQ